VPRKTNRPERRIPTSKQARRRAYRKGSLLPAHESEERRRNEAEDRANETLERLNRGIQESKQKVQQQTMALAQDFFGDSVEELKQQIKDNHATLEKLPDQIPGGQEESFRMLFQQLMDNYVAIEEELDEAGQNVANLDTERLVRQGEVEATDAARREARELGVNLTEIEGTDSEGTIRGDRGNVPDSRSNRVQFTHSDRPNTLVGADDHLQFAEEVIKRSGLPKPIRTKLRQQIERIQKRCADPNLYLAVVGEFSSGKSTFVNALLRDDLLKTSVLPTTAAATKLRHGTSIGAEALFKNSRLRAVKTKSGNSPDDVRRFIQKVTSEDEVAKEVVDIQITHPASFLADGIVIIDTPGTNAINPRHGEITRRVIENEADAAIIIVPATMPLSQTLAAFLDGPLRPYLHRCLFVITKMSQIPLQDQNKVLDYLRQRLALKLEVDLPMVYPCSAQVVMDELTGDVPVPEHQRVWNERFAELEALITERLRQERVLSIAENVTRLLTHMFEQLNAHLRAQWNQYQTRQATIKRATIRDLPSFAAEQRAQCNQMLQKAVSDTALRMDRLNHERRSQRRTSLRQRPQKPQEHNPFGKHVVGGDGGGDDRGGLYDPEGL
jgi:GTPase SAR1 family protein